MRLLIAGCGYTGVRIARRWLAAGADVSALVRSASSKNSLFAAGIHSIQRDLDSSEGSAFPHEPFDLLYYLAPPPLQGETDPRIRNLLDSWSSADPPRRIVYFSTSGVYGSSDGGWVDESCPVVPTTARSMRRLDAEGTVKAYADRFNCEYAILRVPGIYGPERVPLERVARGLPVVRAQEAGWSNRVHVEDLADAAFAAGEIGAATGIFNVSDGHPGTMTEYFQAIAEVFGLPALPEVRLEEAAASLSPEMMSYLQESRRLDISHIRDQFGFAPRYPDLREALCRIRDGVDL